MSEIDFRELLTPEQQARLDRAERIAKWLESLSPEELGVFAAYTYVNSGEPHIGSRVLVRGESVYDATLYYLVIPELLRRLDIEEKDINYSKLKDKLPEGYPG